MKGTQDAVSVSFRGILAIGNTKSEAVNRYRLLALGKGVSMYTDTAQSNAFISNSASTALAELFNPITGDMDIVQSPDLLTGLEFESKSSDVEVNHYECTAGCGAHLVYDDAELVNHCPVCASDIDLAAEDTHEGATDDVSDEDFDADEDADTSEDDDSSGDEDSSEDEDDTSESSDEDADEDDDSSEDDEDDADTSEDDESSDDDEDDDTSDDDSGDEPLVIAASNLESASKLYAKHKRLPNSVSVSSGTSDHEINYCICTSATCGAHILSDEDVSVCPACESEVREPRSKALASGQLLSYSSDDADADLGTDITAEDEDEDDDTSDDDSAEDVGDEESEDDDTSESSDDDDEADAEEDEEDADADEADSCDDVTASDDDEDEPEDDDVNDEHDDNIEDDDALDSDDDSTEVDVDSSDDIDDDADSVAEAHQHLDVAYCGTLTGGAQWLALYRGVPVASISREQAGKNKDIFDTATFGQVVIASAKHVGVRATLSELGFKPYIRTVSISSIVNTLADEKINEVISSTQKEQQQYKERFQAALATAAVGLNRGFFVGLPNPLKDELHSALSTSGIRNPDAIIAKVFREHADSYHKVLFAKANDIMTKPVEVQESLAMTILDTNYSESLSNNGVNKLDEVLGNMGTVVATSIPAAKVPAQQESLSADIVDINRVVSSLGRRR